MVDIPRKIWIRQLGWLFHSQMESHKKMFQTTNQMFMPCFTLKNHTFCLKSNWGTPNCKRMMIYLSLSHHYPHCTCKLQALFPFSDVNLTSSWVYHGISHEIPQYSSYSSEKCLRVPMGFGGFFHPSDPHQRRLLLRAHSIHQTCPLHQVVQKFGLSAPWDSNGFPTDFWIFLGGWTARPANHGAGIFSR